MPPAKRQRLSPGPSSPYTQSTTPYANAPNHNNISLPRGVFNNTNRVNGIQGPNSTPSQSPMPPPQRPVDRAQAHDKAQQKEERPLDVSELNDLVASSGINLRDEEDYLSRSYGIHNRQRAGGPGTGSFDLLSQNRFGNLGASRSNQQQAHERTHEQEEAERHELAARRLAENQQWHLQDPFLWGASVRQKMQGLARDNVLSIPIDGLWDRVPERNANSTDAQKAPSMLNKDAPMEPILSLLSLATNQRLRDLLEDAYGLAQGRQKGSDGAIPPEWADVATQEGFDSADGGMVTGDTNKQSNGVSHTQTARATTPSVNPINIALTELIKADRKREEERLKKRTARRAAKAEKAAAAATGSSTQTPADSGTPAPEAIAPAVPKMTKKERDLAAKKEKDISAEAQTQTANITAAMQLGGKQYSWMTGGKAAARPAPKPSMRPGAGAADAHKKKEGLAAIGDRKFGTWREDGKEGKGLQLRDWIAVLDMDGRERKTLAWAHVRIERLPGEAIANPAQGSRIASAQPPAQALNPAIKPESRAPTPQRQPSQYPPSTPAAAQNVPSPQQPHRPMTQPPNRPTPQQQTPQQHYKPSPLQNQQQQQQQQRPPSTQPQPPQRVQSPLVKQEQR